MSHAGQARLKHLAPFLQHEARTATQTALRQSERYTDPRGQSYLLASMSGAEALLVLALLERHAETLHRGELAEHLLNAGATSDGTRQDVIGAHHRVASIDAATWLRETPLHRALRERASQ